MSVNWLLSHVNDVAREDFSYTLARELHRVFTTAFTSGLAADLP